MKTRRTAAELVFPAILTALIGIQTADATSLGPIGTYYGTDYPNSQIIAIQGSNVGTTPQQNVTQNAGNEGPLAVLPDGTVTTTGMSFGLQGGNYTAAPALSLTPNGLTNGNPLPGNHDATTNGSQLFTVTYTGDVYSLNTDWSNPQLLFSTGNSFNWGITYDFTNSTLWVQDFGGRLTNYTMGGAVLSSFLAGYGSGQGAMGLAMDLDGTLWFSDYQTSTLEHYDTSGNNLGSFTFTNPGVNPTSILGAEIGTPEPGTIFLIALPLAGIVGRRFAKQARRTRI